MKIYTSTEEIGKTFAYADSKEQAVFINCLGHELKVCCRTESKLENQICHITDDLDIYGKHFIKELAEFIKLREK